MNLMEAKLFSYNLVYIHIIMKEKSLAT